MKAVVLKKTGNSSVLELSSIPKPTVKETEVLVNIKFAGVNYADILSRQGLYNWMGKLPYVLGLEGSGVVEEIGSKVKSFKVGDKVIVGGKSGTYAEYVKKDEGSLFVLPEWLSLEQGCILPGAYLTAWVAMFELARVKKNDSVLIHSGAGGVGIAAIEFAKAMKLNIYSTTSSPEKKKYLEEKGVTALDYEDFDKYFEDKQIFPDFILESVGGDVHERSKKILAPLGRIVSIGASSIKIKNKLNPFAWYKAWKALPRIKRNDLNSQGYMNLHVGYLFEDSYDYLEPCWYRMIEFMEKHKIKPTINKDQIFPISEVAKAHDLIDERKNVGKVLLIPRE